MRIKLTDQDIEDLELLLNNHDCLSQWEIDSVNRLLKKFDRAKKASLLGPIKIDAIGNAGRWKSWNMTKP